MSDILAETQAANRDSTIWHQWCRLCSKEHPTNQNVFFREAKQNSWASTMAMTIGKYFWVDIHLDTHSAEIYECTVCGLKLKTRRTFNKHKLVHSDTRQFKCEVCGSAFKRSKTLKAHLILHTGIRPYKCNFCGRDFANGSNCRSHKRQAHPKELAEEEARGVTRSTLLPMLDELTIASKLLKTPAGPCKVKGSRTKAAPKGQDNDNESPTKDTDGAILYELVEELDYS
ncbi:GD20730 [Drosophila simulans]|uniref:GD20730 n=1 Tax=Drosophila simulans TaxID=7240 RepID=B4QVA7_DROSI|nr:GD20730 [Drosophila simulans]